MNHKSMTATSNCSSLAIAVINFLGPSARLGNSGVWYWRKYLCRRQCHLVYETFSISYLAVFILLFTLNIIYRRIWRTRQSVKRAVLYPMRKWQHASPFPPVNFGFYMFPRNRKRFLTIVYIVLVVFPDWYMFSNTCHTLYIALTLHLSKFL